LRYAEHDRGCKPSTLQGYRSVISAHLLPAFGSMAVEAVTSEAIERWIATVDRSVRTRNKLLILLHGILDRARKVYGLPLNAAQATWPSTPPPRPTHRRRASFEMLVDPRMRSRASE
jgi:hypothetical protein